MDKKYIISIIAIAIIVVVIGIFFLNGNSANQNPDELTIIPYFPEPASGFDPLIGEWGCGHLNFEPLIQSTLFKTSEDGNTLTNDLAKNYTVSSDGLTWTVNIRDDVKFSDNVSLTANDVAFTFNQAKATIESQLDLGNFNNATATSNSTVEFRLKKPQSTFILDLRWVGIVPEHAYNNESYGKNPIGSGPYKLTQWNKGQQAIFEINDNYYGEKPYFKKITMLFKNADAAVTSIKSKEVDVGAVDFNSINSSIPGYDLINLSAGRAEGISFPIQNDTGLKTAKDHAIGNNVTADIAIRKALNTGINRQKIVDDVFQGYGAPEYTGVDSRIYGNPEGKIKDNDLEGAKKILEDAGWKVGSDGIREKDGLKASFKLYYVSSDQQRQTLATIVSESGKELGINIELIGSDWDTIYANEYSSAVTFRMSSEVPFMSVYQQFHSRSPVDGEYMNPGLYNNSKVDSYLDNALSSTDQNASLNDWKQAAWDGTTGFSPAGDAPWLWLVTNDCLYFINNNVDIGTPPKNQGQDLLSNILKWKRNTTSV
ncbi:MAG: ABC transporter substrate-binding protein [Methanobrevibacter sp.]|jgi:peptide/nickel transport system substrate-binding protein|nr:ABC transporter substrate-binding protein [Candidatus Methanovirga meridionalis]